MNFAKTAFDKVTDLERYVNTLAKRIGKQKANTVVFHTDYQKLSESKVFDFSVEVSEDTQIFLDLNTVVSGFSGAFSVAVSINGTMLENKEFQCDSVCPARFAFSFAALKGQNEVTVAVSANASVFTLNNMALILNGMNLLDKSPSQVFGIFNESLGVWVFGEARNNVLNAVSQQLTTFVNIRVLDFPVQEFFMHRLGGVNFAFLSSGGGLYAVAMNQLSQLKKINNSVSNAAAVHCNGVDILFLVCRSRLYQREIDVDLKSSALVPLELNREEKILKVRSAGVSLSEFVLCVQTTTKIYIYMNSNGKFRLLEMLSSTGLTNCFVDGQKIFVAVSNNNVTRIFTHNTETGFTDAGKNLGSFESFFQLSASSALVSKDNKLSVLNY